MRRLEIRVGEVVIRVETETETPTQATVQLLSARALTAAWVIEVPGPSMSRAREARAARSF